MTVVVGSSKGQRRPQPRGYRRDLPLRLNGFASPVSARSGRSFQLERDLLLQLVHEVNI